MSGHLIGCAGAVKGLGKSHKLALLAFADSADDRTHIGFPGYPGVQQWADCSRSRAAELIKDLVDSGHLRLHKTARPGRRAEYIVFPDGCCDLHRTPAGEDDTLDLDALAAATGMPVTAVASLVAAMRGNGSEISDPSSGNGSETPDPSGIESTNGSEISDPSGERVQNASEISDPYASSSSSPLPPASGGTAAGAKCPKHPAGDGPNCRPCGTTPRQLAAQASKDRAAQRRAAEAARHEQARRAAAATRRDSTDPRASTHLSAARAAAAASRTAAKAGASR